MKSNFTYLISLVFLSLSVSPARGLDIPLSGGGAAEGGEKIAYVDLERIFQIYPQTKIAKEDYNEQLRRKPEALDAQLQEIDAIEKRISILESTLQGASQLETSTTTAPSPEGEPELASLEPAAVLNLKQELEGKKADYEDARKRTEEDLASFESRQSQIILGKIYQALKDLALEEQVSLVVDKASILYGSTQIDLTDKLQQRVRGY